MVHNFTDSRPTNLEEAYQIYWLDITEKQHQPLYATRTEHVD